MLYIRLLLFAMAALLSPIGIIAQTNLVYSAYTGEQELSDFGTTRKENYDVAIHLTEADLVGSTISGIRIPVRSVEKISNMKVWLSDNLTVSNSINVPSILSQDVELTSLADNAEVKFIEVKLNSPYTITENGVYVGYSFDMDELTSTNGKPIVGVKGTNPEMSYLRSSRTYRSWNPRVSTLGFNSALQVLITDGVHNGATTSLPTKNVQVNQTDIYEFEVINKGSNGISSVDFTWSIAGMQGTEHKNVTVDSYYNKKGEVSFTLPAIDSPGIHPLTIQITKVNGVDNEVQESSTGDITAYSILPVHRPLVEEYTGTTCGYCPRGIVGMEKMHRMFGDDFVAISYHQYAAIDPMDFGYIYSNAVTGYPIAYINRDVEADPYFGLKTSGFHFDEVWNEVRKEFKPIGIDLVAHFTDTEQNQISIRTITTAGNDIQGNYRLTYILIADSLTGEGQRWMQSNFFSGSASYPDEDMQVYTQGEPMVSGVVYNDVAVAWSEEKVEKVEVNGYIYELHNSGIEGSLPETLTGGVPVEHTYTFNIADNKVIQKKNKLTVIAAIVDGDTKKIVNANKARVLPNTADGINEVENNVSLTVTKRYYTVDGKQIHEPQKGVNIVRTSDGKAFKIFVK